MFELFVLKLCFRFACSYRPNISVEYVSNVLAFDSTEKCKEWLDTFSLPYAADGAQIDCKNAASIAI